MWSYLFPHIVTAAQAAWEWMPALTTALNFGTATVRFGLAARRVTEVPLESGKLGEATETVRIRGRSTA